MTGLTVCIYNICVWCVFQAMMTNVFHFCLIVIPMMFSLSVFSVITDSMLTKSVSPSDTGDPQTHFLDWTGIQCIHMHIYCTQYQRNHLSCKCFLNALNVNNCLCGVFRNHAGSVCISAISFANCGPNHWRIPL